MPSTTPPAQIKTLLGHKLASRLRHFPAHWRVNLAVDLIAGNATLANLTVRQACKITGASPYHVNARRRQLAGGASLAEVRHARAVDRLIDRVIAHGGVDRLMTRLDELTAPAVAAE
jgi:hypothetical protein